MWNKVYKAVLGALYQFSLALMGPAWRGLLTAVIAYGFWITDGFWDFLDYAWDKVPEQTQADFQPFVVALSYGNSWLPLQEMFSMLMAFYSFYLAFVCVRFIIRTIPTMG